MGIASMSLRAGVLALVCATGLLGGSPALAAEYPYTPSNPQTHPGGNCVTAGALPWIGNTDVRLSVGVDGQSNTEGHPQARFVLRQQDSSEPVLDVSIPAGVGSSATLRVPQDLLPEKENYWWQARLEGTGGASPWTTACGFNMDRTRPAEPAVSFLDAATYPQGAPPGTPRTVRFTLPEGTEATRICFDPERELNGCPEGQGIPIGPEGTVTATFITPERTGPASISARTADRAGNISDRVYAEYWVQYPFIERFGDYNSDGHPDLLGVGEDGKLVLSPGVEGGGFAASQVADGRDWSHATVARAGWLLNRYGPQEANDVRNDIVALQDGKLFAYPGDGLGGFGAPAEITGYDWSHVTRIALNRTEDSSPMLLAVESDRLLLFELQLQEGLWVGEPSVLGTSGWSSTSVHFSDTPSESGAPSFWARDAEQGTLQLFPLDYGTSQMWDLGTPTTVAAAGWAAAHRPQLAVVGDVNADGTGDVVTGDGAGELALHPAAPDGSLGSPEALNSPAWSDVTLF
ncbi:hypothetical protein ACIGO6_12400 [Streptomyces sp. NPDC053750]|uniref:hypothetical protein n=1 Tax=Streptomyces sp. NPDC053750 TaxID=3365714 RepID=UPI0037D08160